MDPFHDYYGIPWYAILGVWSFIAIGLHVYQVGFIIKLIRLGKDDDRFNSWKKRIAPEGYAFPGDPRNWEQEKYGTAKLSKLGEKILGLEKW